MLDFFDEVLWISLVTFRKSSDIYNAMFKDFKSGQSLEFLKMTIQFYVKSIHKRRVHKLYVVQTSSFFGFFG